MILGIVVADNTTLINKEAHHSHCESLFVVNYLAIILLCLIVSFRAKSIDCFVISSIIKMINFNGQNMIVYYKKSKLILP